MSFWAHDAWDGAATPTLPGKQQVVRQGVETLLEICRSDPKSGPGMLEAKQAQEHMHRLEHVGSLLAVILGQYLHRRRSRHRQLLPKLDPSWWFSNESLKPSTFLVDQLVTGIQLSALPGGVQLPLRKPQGDICRPCSHHSTGLLMLNIDTSLADWAFGCGLNGLKSGCQDLHIGVPVCWICWSSHSTGAKDNDFRSDVVCWVHWWVNWSYTYNTYI